MIMGIISDAHGNIFGLNDCIDALISQGVQKIFFLGDAVDYFGKCNEVLNVLKEKNIRCIAGNHEKLLINRKNIDPKIEKVYNLNYTKKTISGENLIFIKSWKSKIELSIDKYKILLVHASPFNYFEDYIYPNSDLSNFENLNYDVIIMGHTHIPFIKIIYNKYIINVGSVGFRRDKGNLLSCVLFDFNCYRPLIIERRFPIKYLEELKPFSNTMYNILEREKQENHDKN